MRKEGRRDMTKLIVAFLNFAKEQENTDFKNASSCTIKTIAKALKALTVRLICLSAGNARWS
jgi:hypothetical protein